MEEKRFSKKDLTLFAERCMKELLSKAADDNHPFPEISSYDLWRIHKILRKYSEVKE